MKIHSLRGRLHMQICDFEHRERMWKTGLAQAMGLPPKKGSVHRIIETVLLVPITDDLYRETGIKSYKYQADRQINSTLSIGCKPTMYTCLTIL